MNWHNMSVSEVSNNLVCNLENGLNNREIERRKEKFGENVIKEKKSKNIIIKFLLQFNDFMVIILLIAAGISFFVSTLEGTNDFIDPIIIIGIVVFNAILGTIQEAKAEKSIESLKEIIAPHAKAKRNGRIQSIYSKELVPGDIVILETGVLIPADCRLITSANLKIEESTLTGESIPVLKDANYISKENASIGDRNNMVFSGTFVSFGNGTAIVTDTGMNTEVGKIANMIMDSDEEETPLQHKLAEVGKKLGMGAIIVCLIIFIIGTLKNIPIFEMFMTSIGLAVAAIPEGLPAIVTIVLAIGVQKMAKKNAIIRKLPAVETLGGASVICSDKTRNINSK